MAAGGGRRGNGGRKKRVEGAGDSTGIGLWTLGRNDAVRCRGAPGVRPQSCSGKHFGRTRGAPLRQAIQFRDLRVGIAFNCIVPAGLLAQRGLLNAFTAGATADGFGQRAKSWSAGCGNGRSFSWAPQWWRGGRQGKDETGERGERRNLGAGGLRVAGLWALGCLPLIGRRGLPADGSPLPRSRRRRGGTVPRSDGGGGGGGDLQIELGGGF